MTQTVHVCAASYTVMVWVWQQSAHSRDVTELTAGELAVCLQAIVLLWILCLPNRWYFSS